MEKKDLCGLELKIEDGKLAVNYGTNARTSEDELEYLGKMLGFIAFRMSEITDEQEEREVIK